MDFTLTEEQQAISDLAAQIIAERLPDTRVREIEQSDTWFAADVWRELAKANLLGICLPADAGGSGFGILEACLLTEQVGRHVAPLPVLATLVLAAMPIAEFGTAAQRDRWLPPVVDGEVVLTAALAEAGNPVVPSVPATAATPTATGWRLDGEKHFVAAAGMAAAMLVPARTGEDTVGVFLVPTSAAGVTLERGESTSGEPQHVVRLDGVEVASGDVLGAPASGAAIVDWIVDRATAALCTMQAGVCEEALRITARYVSEREQFGTRIGTFQAVAHRAADAYIDTEAIRLTAWQAAWRLHEGLDAKDELAVAKFWAAEGGQRVVHAAQHLHGGIGVDTDYPIHRYFRWTKQIELTLGGATVSLLRLGAALAAEPV